MSPAVSTCASRNGELAMNIPLRILVALAFVPVHLAFSENASYVFPLKLMLVGGDAGRSQDYVSFLQKHFTSVEQKERHEFKLSYADSVDIVLLDWPQGEEDFPPTYSIYQIVRPKAWIFRFQKTVVALRA